MIFLSKILSVISVASLLHCQPPSNAESDRDAAGEQDESQENNSFEQEQSTTEVFTEVKESLKEKSDAINSIDIKEADKADLISAKVDLKSDRKKLEDLLKNNKDYYDANLEAKQAILEKIQEIDGLIDFLDEKIAEKSIQSNSQTTNSGTNSSSNTEVHAIADTSKTTIHANKLLLKANGVDAITITIVIKDSSGVGISNIIPELLISGSGNITSTCSASNSDGVSICQNALMTTVAENKSIAISSPVLKDGPVIEAYEAIKKTT